MSVDRRSKRRVDVVILTAIPLEYDEASPLSAIEEAVECLTREVKKPR